MKAVLEITSETMRGYKRALRVGQSLEVGRSGMIDFAVEHDLLMSGRHFLIQTDQRACYLEDLGSDYGTIVNDQPVHNRIVLRDQDTIKAGSTTFKIHLQDADESVVFAPQVVRPTAAATSETPTFEVKVAPSGMYLHRGKVDAIAPELLITRMRESLDCLLVIDPKKLDAPLPDGFPKEEILFAWLKPDPQPDDAGDDDDASQDADPNDDQPTNVDVLIPEDTPLIVRLDVPTMEDIVRDHWGKDALVTVFWETDDEPPLAQVRRCAGAFVAPALLRPQFTAAAPVSANDLMLGIDRVLVEDESPDTWMLLSLKPLESELQNIGLIPASAETESETLGAN